MKNEVKVLFKTMEILKQIESENKKVYLESEETCSDLLEIETYRFDRYGHYEEKLVKLLDEFANTKEVETETYTNKYEEEIELPIMITYTFDTFKVTINYEI